MTKRKISKKCINCGGDNDSIESGFCSKNCMLEFNEGL